nr:hypothetical protein [Naviculales sp.]
MKRILNKVIIFETFDIICICFSFGATLAYLNRKIKQKRNLDPQNLDPIVNDLKRRSPLVIPVNVDGTPMKLPLIRGGADNVPVEGLSLTIKNKKLADLIFAIRLYIRKYKKLKLLQIFFAALNASLTTNCGIRFAVGGSLNYVQIILLIFPSTVVGYMVEQIVSNPLVSIFSPLLLILGRGINDIPNEDSVEQCRILCKYAQEYHNDKFFVEMKKLNPAIKDSPIKLEVPFECIEEKLSIVERFKLRRLIKSKKTQKQVQYFKEFIKKFPQCDADSDDVYKEIIDVSKKIKD